MTALLFAEQKDGALNDVTAPRADGRERSRRRRSMCWCSGAGAGRGRRGGGQARGRRRRCMWPRPARSSTTSPSRVAALLVALADHHKTIVAPATANTKNIMPRVAALLDVMQVSEITEVVSPDTFERPIYAGNAIQTVQTTDPVKVITVRTAAFAATPARRGRGADRGARRGRRRSAACRASRARRWRRPTGPN